MAQPAEYNRRKDFTDQDGDDTDHNALNQEFDAAALSINEIRANLALIQKDDGSLKNGIVGKDQLAPNAFDDFQQDLDAAVERATTAADESTRSAVASGEFAAVAQSASQSAALSEDNAAASAANAAGAAKALFDGIYLGSLSSDPTVDGNGQPLTDGDFYFNNVAKLIRTWDAISGKWVNATPSGQFKRQKFAAGTDFTPGTTTTLTLASDPQTVSNIFVHFDAAFQHPSEYSLSGQTLTFTSPIPVGVQSVAVAYLEAVFVPITNAILSFPTYAAASAAAATLPDGQLVEALVNDATLQYVVSAGSLVKMPARAGDGPLNVRQFITSQIDGVTSNQSGIVAAVAAAYAIGAELEWPAGTYLSTGNIPNFWKVQHRGKGVVKRGSSTFTICPRGKSTALNQLFVSLTGSDSNDGLTADYPLRTAQAAFDAIMSVGTSIGGRWEVVFDSGTYNEYATLSGVVTREQIIIRGPDVSGGVPTVVFDGTGLTAQSLNGFLLRDSIYAVVRDIKFSNWNGGTGVGTGDASTGLNAVQECNVWADNVHTASCGTGVAATRSRIYQGRGIVENCDIGSTAFGNTVCTYGYGGATTYRNCLSVAINIRDASAGVVDGMISENNNIGVRCQNQSHTRVSNAAFTNSGTADVYLYTGSSCFFGNGNTHTPGKKLRGQFALDLANAGQIYYDGDTDKFNFGSPTVTPGYKFHFRTSTESSFSSSACIAAFEAASPQLGFNGSATGTFGLQFAIPGTSAAASWLYTAADGNWRVRANNVDSYRFASTVFRPVADNSVALGGSASRWSQVYAGTGTINTSDAREKTTPEQITDAVLDAWGDVQLICFQWLHAVREKGGDMARWHFGVIAQQVRDTFAAHGLDGTRYGLLCYDEWQETPEVLDEDGNVAVPAQQAGNRWGIRADQCLFLEAAYQRRRADRIEARLTSIEAKL